MLGLVVAIVVASAGLGWLLGTRIQSPAEAAAAAQPPEASNITVEVERRILSADVITRGDIVYDEPLTVGLSGSFAEQPEALVVTDSVERDSSIGEGGRAVEVSGRPVFFLTGEIPMYRDLRPGSTGPDVHQVESALASLGYFPDPPDETWDVATGSAVTAWYDAAGYRPNGLSDEDELGLKSARDRLTAARSSVADAEAGLREASEGSGRAEVLSARSQVDAARAALELAELDARTAIEDADRPVRQTQRVLDDVAYARAIAEQRLASAEGGIHPATGRPPTPSEMEELRRQVVTARGEEGQARENHDAAARGLQRTRLEQGALVDRAHDDLAIAEATLSDVGRGVDTTALKRQLGESRDELSEAQADLSELESELGTWLPAGEIVFVPRLPVRVDQIAAERGSVIEESFMTVSGSELAVRASVSEPDATRLSEGQPVEIENPETGNVIQGVINLVGERPGTHGLSADRVYMEILPQNDLPEEVIGSNVRITIPVNSTGGAILAVPAAALSATANGSTVVEVDEGGEIRTVEVETGLAADGVVEVTPVNGSLAEGDQVVVGRETSQ